MRLIDADEVQKIIDHIRKKYFNRQLKPNQFFWDTIRYIEKKVRSLPTVEAKEVVHGEWIAQNEGLTKFMCSVCNGKNHGGHEKFCPDCGADMRKKV